MTFAETILSIFSSLRIGKSLPAGVSVLNPYRDPEVMKVCAAFYGRFYNDQFRRRLIIGINPGRFGAGITGIAFTDPPRLTDPCGITHQLGTRAELSAEFIYRVIKACGGPEEFYRQYYITAVSPLGFTFDDKNLNYYDIRELQDAIEPFAVRCMERLLKANIYRAKCFCVGEGQNFKFLSLLNARHKWFDEIVPLPHPRFIMQYKRKQLDNFVNQYVFKLTIDN